MKKISKKKKAKKTEFSLLAPETKVAFVAGSFNQWNLSSHPSTKDKQGVWKISFALHP